LRSINGRVEDRRIYAPVEVFSSLNPTDLTSVGFRALLDTGATASWISRRVVERLGFSSIGKKPVIVATEVRLRDSYAFRLGMRGENSAPHELPIVFAETIGFMIDQANGFDVLLGMDVLMHCDFAMYRNGQWSLAFG
jgi:hypothetical protein